MTFDFNGLRNMNPEDMIRQLETMKAQAEQQLASFEAMRDRITAITVTCTDPDGLVTVTVGSDGYITDLIVSPHVGRQQYRTLGPVIIATLQEARAQLQERLNEESPR